MSPETTFLLLGDEQTLIPLQNFLERMANAGDAEIAQGGDGVRSSLAYAQLEKQNIRLRDGLIR